MRRGFHVSRFTQKFEEQHCEAGKLQAGANLINCTVGSAPSRSVPSIDVSYFTINGMLFLTQIPNTFVILEVVID